MSKRNRNGYFIIRASRINPATGLKEYARDYGKRGFLIWIDPDKPRGGAS